MPRLSRKNLKKRKSYRKQTKINRKVRKSLKGGNLTPEPLSTSKNVLCNFEDIYGNGNKTENDIYAKKNKSGKLDCNNLYYLDTTEGFIAINNNGKIREDQEGVSQNTEDYIPIVESVHGEVLLTPIKKNLRPINIKRVKGKKENIMSKKNSQSLLKKSALYCKNIQSDEISDLKNELLHKHRDLKEDKIELDKDLCHFYYNGRRNKGYLTDGSVKELRRSKKNNRRRPISPRRQNIRQRLALPSPSRGQTRALPSPPSEEEGQIVYNSSSPSSSPSSSHSSLPDAEFPVYADARLGKLLQKKQPQQPVYTSLDLNTPSSSPSRTLSLTRNSNQGTVYADIEA